jgi:receptor-type tyrosine-protein phosphatase zeta
MPGTAYKVQIGAEGDSGFVSSEDVFETGPGEAHPTPVLAHTQR